MFDSRKNHFNIDYFPIRRHLTSTRSFSFTITFRVRLIRQLLYSRKAIRT